METTGFGQPGKKYFHKVSCTPIFSFGFQMSMGSFSHDLRFSICPDFKAPEGTPGILEDFSVDMVQAEF